MVCGMVVNAMEKKQGEDVQIVVDGMVIVVTSKSGEGKPRKWLINTVAKEAHPSVPKD